MNTTTIQQEKRMGVPLIAVAVICGFAFTAGAWAHWLTTPTPPSALPAQQVIGASEVSDLLARLRPLVKEPDGAWYSNGLELTFYGNGHAHIKLKMPNGDEYSVAATTLRGAVATLSKPSQDLQSALRGWSELKD